MKDGVHYLVVSKDRNAFPRLLKVNAVTGAGAPFYDAVKMQAAFAALPGVSKEDARRLSNQLFINLIQMKQGALITFANDLFYYEFGSDRGDSSDQRPGRRGGRILQSRWPHGEFCARRQSLRRRPEHATARARAHRDGSEKILNGRLDWVYQEEVYGRGNFGAYWWSPDSNRIAFLRIDENPVPEFPVVDHIPLDQRLESTPIQKPATLIQRSSSASSMPQAATCAGSILTNIRLKIY
jgi:dipeptidyl-peptidase-4